MVEVLLGLRVLKASTEAKECVLGPERELVIPGKHFPLSKGLVYFEYAVGWLVFCLPVLLAHSNETIQLCRCLNSLRGGGFKMETPESC